MRPRPVLPAGVFPAGVLPAGVLPAGVLAKSVLPAGVLPAGVLPAGASSVAGMDSGNRLNGRDEIAMLLAVVPTCAAEPINDTFWMPTMGAWAIAFNGMTV